MNTSLRMLSHSLDCISSSVPKGFFWAHILRVWTKKLWRACINAQSPLNLRCSILCWFPFLRVAAKVAYQFRLFCVTIQLSEEFVRVSITTIDTAEKRTVTKYFHLFASSGLITTYYDQSGQINKICICWDPICLNFIHLEHLASLFYG